MPVHIISNLCEVIACRSGKVQRQPLAYDKKNTKQHPLEVTSPRHGWRATTDARTLAAEAGKQRVNHSFGIINCDISMPLVSVRSKAFVMRMFAGL
eukprot:2512820-Amphidinium_carterae.1